MANGDCQVCYNLQRYIDAKLNISAWASWALVQQCCLMPLCRKAHCFKARFRGARCYFFLFFCFFVCFPCFFGIFPKFCIFFLFSLLFGHFPWILLHFLLSFQIFFDFVVFSLRILLYSVWFHVFLQFSACFPLNFQDWFAIRPILFSLFTRQISQQNHKQATKNNKKQPETTSCKKPCSSKRMISQTLSRTTWQTI